MSADDVAGDAAGGDRSLQGLAIDMPRPADVPASSLTMPVSSDPHRNRSHSVAPTSKEKA
jgi:hypothetical protein